LDREDILESMQQYLKGNIEKHRINVEVLLERAIGVSEHPNLVETIEGELAIMADYDDKLIILENYFNGE
jgi:hypothetical protein|tara:strand:+ start:846 stop:1055 length:210 start_codon:yes stop_codon:yes gene_type:complete